MGQRILETIGWADANAIDSLTVTNGERERLRTPSTSDSVDVTAADTAGDDFDIDIVVGKRF